MRQPTRQIDCDLPKTDDRNGNRLPLFRIPTSHLRVIIAALIREYKIGEDGKVHNLLVSPKVASAVEKRFLNITEELTERERRSRERAAFEEHQELDALRSEDLNRQGKSKCRVHNSIANGFKKYGFDAVGGSGGRRIRFQPPKKRI